MRSVSEPSRPLPPRPDLPAIGFGVWQVPDEKVAKAVELALEVGYQLVDTAEGYGNEKGTGAGLRASGHLREDIFLTTKLDAETFGYDNIRRAFDGSLKRLGTDYVDAYLIHWPRPGRGRLVETWEALRRIRDEGGARSIGVCNFEPHHLREVADATGEAPILNQVELHPWLPQHDVIAANRARGVATQAWSPLASGALLDDGVIRSIAKEAGAEPAQVILAWHRQNGNSVVVKSVTPGRIRANAASLSIELTRAQLDLVDALATGRRTGPHPDEF